MSKLHPAYLGPILRLISVYEGTCEPGGCPLCDMDVQLRHGGGYACETCPHVVIAGRSFAQDGGPPCTAWRAAYSPHYSYHCLQWHGGEYTAERQLRITELREWAAIIEAGDETAA